MIDPQPLLRAVRRALGFGDKQQQTNSLGESATRKAHIMSMQRTARFQIGQVVRHRLFPFRGVIFDVDPEFANTKEWYEAIPEEVRPAKDQPFYHLFAENEKTHYVAYVSEQNLLPDDPEVPVNHPEISKVFDRADGGGYQLKRSAAN